MKARTASTGSIFSGSWPVLRGHSLDDARHVDDRALMGPGADLFLAVHRPNAEEDLAIVAARDFRMAYDLAPDRRRHEMAHVDPVTDVAFARLEVLLLGTACRFLHDGIQV